MLARQTASKATSKGDSPSKNNRLLASSICLALSYIILFAAPAAAQVAITVGVQEMYDDNVFLENDERRPAPLVIDGALEDDLTDGELSVFSSEQADGDPDDDLITNVYVNMSTELPQIEKYANAVASAQVGGLFFADFTEQNRLTLDANFDASVSKHILPDPFYASAQTGLDSRTNDVSVAEGTASKSAETWDTSLRLGVRGEIAPQTTGNLGYVGAYHKFLGELLFSDDEDDRFEEKGSDYHTHTARTTLEHEASQETTFGIASSVGVQLFTNVESSDPLSKVEEQNEDEFDRTNADLTMFVRHTPTAQLSLLLSAGLQFTEFHDDQGVTQQTVIGKDGMPLVLEMQRDDSQSSFEFSGSADYLFEPGTSLSLGAGQEVGTDIDGQRITVRSVFTNLTKSFGDRFRLDGGFSFVQYSNEDDLSNSSDRAEFSASGTYQLTQFTALVVGYNYITQNEDDSDLDSSLRFRSGDYDVNRVFVSLNVGLVGIPL